MDAGAVDGVTGVTAAVLFTVLILLGIGVTPGIFLPVDGFFGPFGGGASITISSLGMLATYDQTCQRSNDTYSVGALQYHNNLPW